MVKRHSFTDEYGEPVQRSRSKGSAAASPPSQRKRSASPRRDRLGADLSDRNLSKHGNLQMPDDLSYCPPEDDWVSRAYQHVNREPPGAVAKWVQVGAVSALFVVFLFGALLVVVAALEQYHPVVRLCPHCGDVIISMYVIGSASVALSVVGCSSVRWRLRLCAAGFFVFMLVLGLLLLALGIFILVFRVSPQLPGFSNVWESTVQSDPSLVCTLQSELGCSGFQSGCCFTNTSALVNDSMAWSLETFSVYCFVQLANGTYLSTSSGTTATNSGVISVVQWPGQECPKGCMVLSNEVQMCNVALRSRVDEYAVAMLVAVFCLAVVVFIGAVLTCRSAFRPAPLPERVFLLAASDE